MLMYSANNKYLLDFTHLLKEVRAKEYLENISLSYLWTVILNIILNISSLGKYLISLQIISPISKRICLVVKYEFL